MLELGTTPNAAPAADLIIDGTDATFMQDVIEASQTVPVIVDFWTPRSPQSQALDQGLEGAVRAEGGRLTLVRINVDTDQVYAEQLRVQSIPTVFAFHEGQPVDGFQGALPPSEIQAFVDKIAALGGEPDNGLADAVEAAEQMLADGEAADAAETFAAILQEDPAHAGAYAGLVRSHLALGDVDQAEAVLNGAPAEISTDVQLEAAHAQVVLAREAENAGPVAELAEAVEANPDDHQARFDLAVAQHANGDAETAVATLLELFRRDREWNDGAARTQLFKIFDALPANDPVVLNGRRKLSSLIFA